MKRELAKLEAVYLALSDADRDTLVAQATGLVRSVGYIFRTAPPELRAACGAFVGAAIPKVLLLFAGAMKEDKFAAYFPEYAPALCEAVKTSVAAASSTPMAELACVDG